MVLDAILAYLHYSAIFLLFAFLTVETMMMRGTLDAASVRVLGRVDIWYFSSAIAALATGLSRAIFGAKGPDFYFSAWPIYVKIGLFIAIGSISVLPTLEFIRWRRAFAHDAAYQVAATDRARVRRLIMIEVHLAAVIPLVAVFMSRGVGH